LALQRNGDEFLKDHSAKEIYKQKIISKDRRLPPEMSNDISPLQRP